MVFPPPDDDGVIRGRDGRHFMLPSVETLNSGQESFGQEAPIDLQHATEKWWSDDDAPAFGWMKGEFYAGEDGSVWVAIEWTDLGVEALTKKHFRYFSPAVRYEYQTKDVDGVTVVDWDAPPIVVHVTSGGLTNSPNLHMPALNSRHGESGGPRSVPSTHSRSDDMDRANLATLLGLHQTASEADIIHTIKAGAESLGALGLDYKSAPSKAAEIAGQIENHTKLVKTLAEEKATAEKQLHEFKQARAKEEVDRWIDESLKAGRMTPATSDTYRTMAEHSSEMFEHAKKLVSELPEKAGGAPPPPANAGDESPTGEIPAAIHEIARQTGKDPKELFRKYREEIRGGKA